MEYNYLNIKYEYLLEKGLVEVYEEFINNTTRLFVLIHIVMFLLLGSVVVFLSMPVLTAVVLFGIFLLLSFLGFYFVNSISFEIYYNFVNSNKFFKTRFWNR
jgi:hypothetical protein